MKNYNYILHLLRIRKEDGNCYLTITPYGKIIELNEVGYQILNAAKKFDNVQSLISHVASLYNILEDEIEQDILEFMNDMELCGIIEILC